MYLRDGAAKIPSKKSKAQIVWAITPPTSALAQNESTILPSKIRLKSAK
jgi:hypothetical protein